MATSMMLTTPITTPTIPSPRPRPSCRRIVASRAIRSSSDSKEAANVEPIMLDRRNILLGLSGVYGATAVGGSAFGEPLQAPDLTACKVANYPDGYNDLHPVQCCPPYDLRKPLDIRPYSAAGDGFGAVTRTRKPAHKLSRWEQDRFKRAVAEMKKLPRNHPWSFMQQAQVHCAYCNEGYNQKGYDVPLQVHFSWLFAPWHRWYLYFFEKILGKLVDDDTVALPFWNYDDEAGMAIPFIYKDPSSSLYNPNRNMNHKDAFVNLRYTYDIETSSPPQSTIVRENLTALANMFDEDSLGLPELFLGDRIAAGERVDMATSENSSGKLENLHNFVHTWAGQVEPPNLDMGNFYSAARDMLFYAHHANIDRLWHLYREKRNNALEFDDRNWVDATFVFYDENEKIVSVKVKDALDTQQLGYTYEDTPLAYMNMPKRTTKPVPTCTPATVGSSPGNLEVKKAVSVARPETSRSAESKAKAAEVLVVDGIELTSPAAAAFDVFVSNSRKEKGVLVGTYNRVRHNNTHEKGSSKMKFQVGITEDIEEIGADGDGTLVVTLVPHSDNVKIGGVRIQIAPKQSF